MHIELDVLEITFLIMMWMIFKWGCRFLIIVFVVKVAANIKAKAVESIGNIRKEFEGKEDTKSNS
jgi:hypothetical protein